MLEGREWRKNGGASDEAIQKLRDVAPVVLPESYFALLSLTNGGEGPLPTQPLWLALDAAEEVIETEQQGTFKEFFPGFFVIGSNGGGEAIAFDLRTAGPYPLVAFDITNSDLIESVWPIALDFDEFLGLIGLSDE
ncbi:SMI1/KNR4 family protein [Mesorhizobium newzealandense]|uniref:SMI1/KNR4 family protein n=1 Tax=Mesorhizobium newzealandense TaxID=1300302 RepID=A0ABW4UNW5_9HYPH